ncbi:hypothetical protein [Microbacterium dextranolyticum]|uniref:Hemagglutinin n=1 Tax=Microbacterium dextranolyticum TaxID=36806 RepID=A0A9W6HLB7_9MICO|nr:hypothetical protein [Microbacterium dextranolyticum]MBM7463760.1 hypothetical protein [Microbacterium dextranolyticum]GLJ94841.1 hypothetical protein GCM10017591_09030 [Microbacterium dextranolyticum]
MHTRTQASTPARSVRTKALVAIIAAAVAVLSSLAGAGVAHADPARSKAGVQAATTGVPTNIMKTAVGAGFDPENIISDALFYDGNAMSAGEIQAFLDAKIGSCGNGKCLNVLTTGISSRDAWYSAVTGDLVCSAIQGGTMRVSDLIYRVQVACGISAKAILVTLQKEQGLVTNSAPSDWNLRAAMGASCPDTEPCDPAFAGVGPQILKGVQQLKIYKAGRFAKQPGINFIGYSPDSSCGGTTLNIRNYATAALYNYTPYQPNAASLAAGWGLGDGCSSYGNRNFYNYYTSWFGSAQGDALQVVQVSGTSERYLVSGGSRWTLSTDEIAAQFTWIASVSRVSRDQLNTYADMGKAKRAVRARDGSVFMIDSGQRMRLQDVPQVGDFGWTASALPLADDGQLARYRDGGYLQRVVQSGGTTWLIQGGARRQVVDLGLLARYGISPSYSSVSDAALSEYRAGAPVIDAGLYRSGASIKVQTDAGVYSLSGTVSESRFTSAARELAPDSFVFLKESAALPLRVSTAGRAYVLSDDGWIKVSLVEYPSSLPFTPVGQGALTGIPLNATVDGPHFVREHSDSTVFLLSGGGLQPVSRADQTWISRTYGVSPQVIVLTDGVIADASTPEGLAKSSTGVAYLLDGARAFRLRDCAQVADWGGNCAALRTVSDQVLAGYGAVGNLQPLIRTSDAVWLVQGGQRRQVIDPSILAPYGIGPNSTAVSTSTANQLPIGEPVLAPGVYTNSSGSFVVATGGGSFTLSAGQAVGAMTALSRPLVDSSFAKIAIAGAMPSRVRSDGRSFVLTDAGWLDVDSSMYGDSSLFMAMPSGAWRGIPLAATDHGPHFVRSGTDEYLVSGGSAQSVAGASERAQITAVYGVAPTVWNLVADSLVGVRLVYDLIVTDANGAAYLIDGSKKYRLDCGQVVDFAKACTSLRTVSAAALGKMTDGGALAPLLRSGDNTLWLPQGGARREVPDPRVLAPYGIGTSSSSVSDRVLARLKLGAPVLGAGFYDDGAGTVRFVTSTGASLDTRPAQRIGTVIAGAKRITSESLAFQPVNGNLPDRITAAGRRFVLTSEGLLEVSAAAYGALPFSELPGGSTAGLPMAGSERRPHFVREQSTSTVYLASGGLSPAGDESHRAAISAVYGVPTHVWVVPDGALS